MHGGPQKEKYLLVGTLAGVIDTNPTLEEYIHLAAGNLGEEVRMLGAASSAATHRRW